MEDRLRNQFTQDLLEKIRRDAIVNKDAKFGEDLIMDEAKYALYNLLERLEDRIDMLERRPAPSCNCNCCESLK